MEYRFLSALLTIFLFSNGIEAINCPNGYTLNDNGLCYKTYNLAANRKDASNQCKSDGGLLVEIDNAFTNSQIMNSAKAIGTNVWLGLTCTTGNKAGCVWDGGKEMVSSDYDNFYPQNPNTDFGNCVYMSVTSNTAGRWFSTDCDLTKTGFTCQYGGTPVATCPNGYTMNGDYCYYIIPTPYAVGVSESLCQNNCANVASIHTDTENAYIQSLFLKSFPQETFVRIGLVYNYTNHYEWLDGSMFNSAQYSNFGHVDQNLGYCFGMALTNQLVQAGQWMNTQCNHPMYAVCKRPVGNCAGPTNLPPTDQVCKSPYFMDGNGTILSPGYPNTYVLNTCEYIIGVPEGYVATVSLLENNLDPQSYIELYNDVLDNGPFQIIYPNTPLGQFSSSESNMKIIFTSPYSPSGSHQWKLSYYPTLASNTPSTCNCNCGTMPTPGRITSPNYPSNYPDNANCSYSLLAPSNQRVSISFTEVITESGLDIVTIYDGPTTSSPVIKRLSGSYLQPTNFTATANSMLVRFTSDSRDNAKGFTANFFAV